MLSERISHKVLRYNSAISQSEETLTRCVHSVLQRSSGIQFPPHVGAAVRPESRSLEPCLQGLLPAAGQLTHDNQ